MALISQCVELLEINAMTSQRNKHALENHTPEAETAK
jgi:hypothetical protein